MKRSTTIVNYSKTDRVVKIIIPENEYLIFTLNRNTLVVIDITVKNRPILLRNKTYTTNEALNDEFDRLIIMTTKVYDNDEFVYYMDTYIDLLTNSIKNETSTEILATYDIIVKDYNL